MDGILEQHQFATDVQSNAVLVTATRQQRAPPIFASVNRPATKAAMETRFCYNVHNVNAKKMDACLYDND